MVKKKSPPAGNGQAQDNGQTIIPVESQTPKEATYVLFPLACLRSDYPLEEIPPADARRIFQRCLAWHIVTAKVEPRLFSDLIDNVSAIEALAAEVATNYGKQRALFPTSLFRSAMNDWSYRKFAILAAVYASVGQCEYRVVVRDKITAGSVGFSNQEEREAFGSTFEPITVSKLRTTLDHLVTSRLITRAKYTGRTTAYGRVKPDVSLPDKIQKRSKAKQQWKPGERDPLILECEEYRRKQRQEKQQEENGKPFDEAVGKKHYAELGEQSKPAAPAVPKETSDERDARLARESFAREEASQRRNLRLYPAKKESPTTEVAKPPKEPPTPEEVEARRQQLMRLVGEN